MYDPLRDSWGGTWGETWGGSWCWDLPTFGKWVTAKAATCLWDVIGQGCRDSAIASIAIASQAIANKICEDTTLKNEWVTSSAPCQWVKVHE